MSLQFDEFELRLEERKLLVRGAPVTAGARAYDLLVALVQNRDRVVRKNELLDMVWPDMVVEENNLTVHISALRKLLGPGVIATIPGRGYRFTGRSGRTQAPGIAHAAESRAPPDPGLATEAMRIVEGGNVPVVLPTLFGRDSDLLAVCRLLETERLVTVCGAGGIGKTRLAEAAAHRMRDRFADGVWLTDFSALADPSRVVPFVAEVLGIALPQGEIAVDKLVSALRCQNLLLVLDGCEHLLEVVGMLTQALVRGAPLCRILATSQELLRTEGEYVFKLAPLAVPATDKISDAIECGATRLFLERVKALDRRFELNPDNVPLVVEICNRLDGLPLAIELAAARAPLLGVRGIRDRLGERFRMLTGGKRISLPRHQTLRAALAWSHHLLSTEEQTVFRRLGVFSGGFVMEGAQLVVADDQIDEWSVLEHLSALVDKSLVMVDGGKRPRYRLLESAHAYAMEKLAESGETDAMIRRHGLAMRTLCEAAVRQRDIEWMWSEMNNVAVAFSWALGRHGDAVTAIVLATSTSVVLAVSGHVAEALERLLQVEPLVSDATPPPLAARFWQWLGRCGIDGRLPTSRCLEALDRAQNMFRAQHNGRHLHACLRATAEALIRNGDFNGAQAALQEAHAMEDPDWALADRMRRLRIEGLLLDARNQFPQALDVARQAFDLAAANGIDRYVLILGADIARLHLKMGHTEEAGHEFRELAAKARLRRFEGLTLSYALAGLTAVLLIQDRVTEAQACARQAVPLLHQCGILSARADILAWLLACSGAPCAAAQFLAASNAFHTRAETARDHIETRAREAALALIEKSASADRIASWMSQGARLSEDDLVALFSHPDLAVG